MQMNKDIVVPIVYSCGLLLLFACSHTGEQTITQLHDKEIAKMLEISEGTSKSQYARARSLLQEKIRNEKKMSYGRTSG